MPARQQHTPPASARPLLTLAPGYRPAVGQQAREWTTSEGLAFFSTDGIQWQTAGTGPGATVWADALIGDELWVAGDGGAIVSTADGNLWQSHNWGTRNVEHVVFGGSRWIVSSADDGPYGIDSHFLSSSDGLSWVGSWPRPWSHFSISAMAWGGTRFVLLGTHHTTESYTVTSEDGIVWQNPSTLSAWVKGACFGGSQFVAWGGWRIWTSPDGRDWTERRAPSVDIEDVTFGGGLFVALGSRGRIATSPDGVDWARRDLPRPYGFYAVAYGQGRFVAAGWVEGQQAIVTSRDGIEWTEVLPKPPEVLTSVVFRDPEFIAVGYSGVVMTSRDGLAWVRQNAPTTNNLIEVAASDSRLVAIGEHGTILASSCSGDGRPAARFSWSPERPTVGVLVTFTDASVGSPRSWEWSFGDGQNGSGSSPTHTYGTAGTYVVTLTGRNNRGSGSVSMTLVVDPPPCLPGGVPILSAPAAVGAGVTYTLTWTATSPEGRYEVQEGADPAFATPVTRSVTGTRAGFGHAASSTISFHYRVRALQRCSGRERASAWSDVRAVTVSPAGISGPIYVLVAAHVAGAAGTNWRTDLEVHNPGSASVPYTVELLVRDQGNPAPAARSFSITSGTTVRVVDAVQALFGFSGAATLRVTPGSGRLMVTSRTYNDQPSGTYGQFIPGVSLTGAITSSRPGRLVQLAQSKQTAVGYRTNVGLVNASAVTAVGHLRLSRGNGTVVKTMGYTLAPYQYIQVDRLFESAIDTTMEDGLVVVTTSTPGTALLAYASVIDNRSGDPVFVPTSVQRQ